MRRAYKLIQRGYDAALANPVMVDWNRTMHVVGPLTDDTTVSGYTRDWVDGHVSGYSGGSATNTAWKHVIDRRVEDANVGGTFKYYFNRKMRPIRFAIGLTTTVLKSDGSAVYGGLILAHRSIAETAVPGFGGVVLQNPKFYPPPSATEGPTSAGHFSGSNVSTLSVGIPMAVVEYAPSYRTTAHVRYVRVIVDGVDVSGTVAITGSVTSTQDFIAGLTGNAVSIAIPEIDVSDKTILVDLWMEVDSYSGSLSTGYNDDASAPDAYVLNGTRAGEYANTVAHYRHFVRGINALNVNAKRATTRNYRLTFSEGITSGLTELTTQESVNWTLTRTSASVLWSFGGNESVELFYAQEIAEILITRYQFREGQWRVWKYRYFPADTGHYIAYDDGTHTATAPGIFNPAASQTFKIVGYIVSDFVYFNPSDQSPYTPFTVTVEPL